MPRSNFLLVAAIDFGTAYSGYAFSKVDDFKQDPLKVIVYIYLMDEKNILELFKLYTIEYKIRHRQGLV